MISEVFSLKAVRAKVDGTMLLQVFDGVRDMYMLINVKDFIRGIRRKSHLMFMARVSLSVHGLFTGSNEYITEGVGATWGAGATEGVGGAVGDEEIKMFGGAGDSNGIIGSAYIKDGVNVGYNSDSNVVRDTGGAGSVGDIEDESNLGDIEDVGPETYGTILFSEAKDFTYVPDYSELVFQFTNSKLRCHVDVGQQGKVDIGVDVSPNLEVDIYII